MKYSLNEHSPSEQNNKTHVLLYRLILITFLLIVFDGYDNRTRYRIFCGVGMPSKSSPGHNGSSDSQNKFIADGFHAWGYQGASGNGRLGKTAMQISDVHLAKESSLF
ncbi:hypothetical protein [Olivibacter sp. XZL3]|uniref:hypothetical protein n=1 Tax=Olivibacter sp. XZL3 TaxID=1735116 RepID=UPI001416F934|nr:hypothetical protein [Olivibacter sp. XZL3]